MLKLTAKKLGAYYGLSEPTIRDQMKKLGLSLNKDSVADMVRLVLFNEFENRQRRDKSRIVTKRQSGKSK